MDELFHSALANIFSAILLAILGWLAKYLRDIVKELRDMHSNVTVLMERLGDLKERVISLEQRRKHN